MLVQSSNSENLLKLFVGLTMHTVNLPYTSGPGCSKLTFKFPEVHFSNMPLFFIEKM